MRQANPIVGVVGLGTIGLPLATFAAAAGYTTVGFDIDEALVERINGRQIRFEYEALLRDLPRERMTASADAALLAGADVVFVCLPTPVDETGRISLDALALTARSVSPLLRNGVLLILESSVEIGTTRWFGLKVEEASGKRMGADFCLAYCPERYNPGLPSEHHAEVIYGRRVQLGGALSYHKIPRVVGGFTSECATRAAQLYRSILAAPVKIVGSMEVAEASKLLENIFRDVNIALVNEFAEAATALGVDAYEAISAAATKNFAFLPHLPGLVGGECIPVDSWYLIRQAEGVGVDCALMRRARAVNEGVIDRVADSVTRLLTTAGVALAGAKVAILGTAYKANVYDDRVSPSRKLAHNLEGRGLRVVLCDPLVRAFSPRPRDTLAEVEDALRDADAVVLAVAHDIFLRLEPREIARLVKHRLLVDVRNALDHSAYRSLGFDVAVLGRVFR